MGASEAPSLLSVDDEDGAQVVDAADLWNSDAEETEDVVSGTLEGAGYGIFAIGDAEGRTICRPLNRCLRRSA
jgi:aldehyde:ferredoxin oxidoreductase